MDKRGFLKIAAGMLAVGLITAACSSASTTGTGSTESNPPADALTGAEAVEAGASSLRATLTAGLQEHVYLAGIAINTAVTTGLDSKATAAAVKTLDGNSKALSAAVDSVYAGAGKTFLPLWRKHIDFFVDYTVAGASGDEAGQMKARQGLDDYRSDFGAFLAGANPNLTKSAVADELVPHVNSVFDVIDAVLAGSVDTFGELRSAASVMPGTATVLAGAIAEQFPNQFK